MGSGSLLHILLLALLLTLLFGPNKLPDVAKSLGRTIRDFKKGLNTPPERDVTEKLPEKQDKQG